MRILRRPGRLAIVLLLLGCAVLVAAIVTVRSANGGDREPSLGPAVNVSPSAGTSGRTTPPSPSPSATDDDDDDDATPVSPGSPSTAGDDDDDDDKHDDKDDDRDDRKD